MSRSRVVLATYTYSWARIETRGPLATYHGRQPEQHCLDNVQCNNTTTPDRDVARRWQNHDRDLNQDKCRSARRSAICLLALQVHGLCANGPRVRRVCARISCDSLRERIENVEIVSSHRHRSRRVKLTLLKFLTLAIVDCT